MQIPLLPSVCLLLAATSIAQVQIDFADLFPAQADFRRPIYLDHTPADLDNYYVLLQTGQILKVARDGTVDGWDVFFDGREKILHPENGGHNEEGLLGMAFAPDYEDSGYVYLYYSERLPVKQAQNRKRGRRRRFPRQSVLSRFSVEESETGRIIDPGSELVVMHVPQPYGNHNGGTIIFGPDGMLYIALGDGGAANDPHQNGQNKATLLATILRVDVSEASDSQPYRVPADNPFATDTTARGEIWAYGLRNPWRMSFDRETGELWCGDVGQNTWEEVDHIVKGGNYGWNLMEATHPFPASREVDAGRRDQLLLPVAEYPRSGGISVTGGYIYRGESIPELQGAYVYGDFQTRNMWAVFEDPEGDAHRVIALGKSPGLLASFAELPNGELVVLCFEGNQFEKSRVYEIVPK